MSWFYCPLYLEEEELAWKGREDRREIEEDNEWYFGDDDDDDEKEKEGKHRGQEGPAEGGSVIINIYEGGFQPERHLKTGCSSPEKCNKDEDLWQDEDSKFEHMEAAKQDYIGPIHHKQQQEQQHVKQQQQLSLLYPAKSATLEKQQQQRQQKNKQQQQLFPPKLLPLPTLKQQQQKEHKKLNFFMAPPPRPAKSKNLAEYLVLI